MAQAPNIFISYCRKDRVWVDRLQEQFAPLARDAKLIAWDDFKIDPGTNWRDEIAKAIADAHVAVLLVTPAFLASEFIAKNELAPLLAKKHVFWIALSYSLYKETVIEKYGAPTTRQSRWMASRKRPETKPWWRSARRSWRP
jgi:hypothetical protein